MITNPHEVTAPLVHVPLDAGHQGETDQFYKGDILPAWSDADSVARLVELNMVIERTDLKYTTTNKQVTIGWEKKPA